MGFRSCRRPLIIEIIGVVKIAGSIDIIETIEI